MGKNSKIEWTDHTFNPWWGCVKVSPGCKNCYAETQANRYGDWWGGNPRRTFGDHHWRDPVWWNNKAHREGVRAKVFCGSMCDVFEDNGMDAERWRLWDMIKITPNLDWLLLTKRPKNVRQLSDVRWYTEQFPDNVWMGTSIEDQLTADERIPELLKIPAKIRFLSVEPILGKVDLTNYLPIWSERYVGTGVKTFAHDPDPIVSGISWIIVGGESGSQARAINPEWFERIVKDCKEANVPVFVKQLGTWWSKYRNYNDYKAGDPSEWKNWQHLNVREFPENEKSKQD